MQKQNRPFLWFAVLALVAASSIALGSAFAGDDVASKPASPTVTDAPAAKAEMPDTKTLSPVHSMMAFLAEQVCGDMESPCPSCPKAEAAWRTWFDGGKDVPMAALRDRLVSDGWTADRYVGYFQQMAAAHPKQGGDCGSCDKDGAASKSDCGGCDKAAKAEGGCCGGCDKAAKADGECCGGCDKSAKADGGCDKGSCDKGSCGKSCDDCPSKGECSGCPSKQEPKPETTAAK